jgi:hypothetical protein
MEKEYKDMSLAERGEATLARKDGYLQLIWSGLNQCYVLLIGDARFRLFENKAAAHEYVGERFG